MIRPGVISASVIDAPANVAGQPMAAPGAVPVVDPKQQEQELARQKMQAENAERLKKYFANKDKKDIAADLMSRVDAHVEFLDQSGRGNLLKRAYKYYYRGVDLMGQLHKAGEQDEYLVGHFNHFRNILQHLINMTTAQRPALEPRAANTDAKSQGQCIIASGALDYYQRELHLDRIFKKATEHGVYLSEGYVVLEWDENIGQDYGTDENGNVKKQGDIRFTNVGPFDCFYDFSRDAAAKHDWYIIRFWENRYDYAAKYPELGEKILALAKDDKNPRNKRPWFMGANESDLIPVYRFFHGKTPATPAGRFTEFLSTDLVTLDGPLPYRRLPVHRMMPDEQDGTPFGYTVAFDIMPVQEAIDGLLSTILTAAATFGVQNIAIPDGANIDVVAVAGGLNIIKYDAKSGKPEILQMLQTPPELFKFVDMLIQMQETLSGLNSVVRGDPQASLKSGAALALVASQAVQFNSGLQQSYAQLCEDVGTGIIDILKEYGNTPRIATIAGKSNRSYMREFKGSDIADINRVTVERVNPISATTAGKMQIADTLLERNLLHTPEEYIQLVTTGRLEPLLQAQQTQLTLIQAENEDLAEGKPVTALLTDDHVLHIKEHQSVLSSPESRRDPAIINACLEHLQDHMTLLLSGDPILGLLGQPVMAPPAPPPPPDAGKGGKGNAADVVDPTAPVTKAAEAVNLPATPNNPQTGQPFDPATGQ